jgi:hypothetical protein
VFLSTVVHQGRPCQYDVPARNWDEDPCGRPLKPAAKTRRVL